MLALHGPGAACPGYVIGVPDNIAVPVPELLVPWLVTLVTTRPEMPCTGNPQMIVALAESFEIVSWSASASRSGTDLHPASTVAASANTTAARRRFMTDLLWN